MTHSTGIVEEIYRTLGALGRTVFNRARRRFSTGTMAALQPDFSSVAELVARQRLLLFGSAVTEQKREGGQSWQERPGGS